MIFHADPDAKTHLSRTDCPDCGIALEVGSVTATLRMGDRELVATYPGKKCPRCGEVWCLPGEIVAGLAAAEASP